jgi:coenzyme F420-reducing hydrogenase delta subunit
VRIIRIHCIGKIDAVHVLKAFENGADGVIIAGAPKGQCRFITGIAHVQNKIHFTRKLLGELGIELERLELFPVSPTGQQKFSDAAAEMIRRVKALGPSPMKRVKKVA